MFFFLNIIRDYSQSTQHHPLIKNSTPPALQGKLWTEIYAPKNSNFMHSTVKKQVTEWLENHKKLYFFNIELSNYKNLIYRNGIIMNISSTRELMLLCKKHKIIFNWKISQYIHKKEIINKSISFSNYRTEKSLDDSEYSLIISYIDKLYQRVDLLDGITLTYGMILHGTSGIGKTKFIELLAQELQFTTIEIDETNLTKKEIDNLRDISNTVNVGIIGEIGSNKPKLILIDPLSSKIYDKAAIQGILKFSNPLKGNRNATYIDKEKLLANLIPPIICICNNTEFSSKKIVDLKKDFICIEIKPPPINVIYDLITTITIDHNMKITKKAKYYIIDKCSHDIRQLIGFLYSLYLASLTKFLPPLPGPSLDVVSYKDFRNVKSRENSGNELITSHICDDTLFYKDQYLATTHIDAINIYYEINH
jgi:DNA polymerase III delta prime subunit